MCIIVLPIIICDFCRFYCSSHDSGCIKREITLKLCRKFALLILLHTEECELYMHFIIRDCYIVFLTIIYSNVSDFVAGGHVKKWTNICHISIDNKYEKKKCMKNLKNATFGFYVRNK